MLLPLLVLSLLFGSLSSASGAPQKEVNPYDSSGFVVLSDVVPDIIQEIRYFSTYNFVGERITGVSRALCADDERSSLGTERSFR